MFNASQEASFLRGGVVCQIAICYRQTKDEGRREMEGARLEFLMGSRSTISYHARGFESAREGCVSASPTYMDYGVWTHHTTKQPLPEAWFIVPLVGLGWWWVGCYFGTTDAPNPMSITPSQNQSILRSSSSCLSRSGPYPKRRHRFHNLIQYFADRFVAHLIVYLVQS